ncbi:hypothetical protein [Desulfovibrio inopinatus]|uniref:hypothetical protein n=1 Tax=Desulfovibrio inopinatus TaxID=102109 RepID=UPI00040B0470|nr:hypothetical protein [Desulfovibrio inopinatus]
MSITSPSLGKYSLPVYGSEAAPIALLEDGPTVIRDVSCQDTVDELPTGISTAFT